VPFNDTSTDDLESCYLIADVDEDSIEYVRGGNVRLNVENRPSVGVTAYSRFKRAPTLDIIRSTQMPVLGSNSSDSYRPVINVSRSNNYFNKSLDQSLKRQYFSNTELNKNLVAAKF